MSGHNEAEKVLGLVHLPVGIANFGLGMLHTKEYGKEYGELCRRVQCHCKSSAKMAQRGLSRT